MCVCMCGYASTELINKQRRECTLFAKVKQTFKLFLSTLQVWKKVSLPQYPPPLWRVRGRALLHEGGRQCLHKASPRGENGTPPPQRPPFPSTQDFGLRESAEGKKKRKFELLTCWGEISRLTRLKKGRGGGGGGEGWRGISSLPLKMHNSPTARSKGK